MFQLFYYMLTMTVPDAAASLYECTDYLPGERTGAIVIDQETGRFQSLTTEVSAEFTMPDGSSYRGTIRFVKVFRAFDGDVSLPLPDGGAAA